MMLARSFRPLALSLSLSALAAFGATTAIEATALGDSCPSSAPLYCSNNGGYCCDNAHPYCTTDGKCSASSQNCPSSAPNHCSNNGGYCCDKAHPYCTTDGKCSASSQNCPSSAPNHCSNNGGYCCDNAHPYCTTDGKCSASGNGGSGGGGQGCPSSAPRYCSNNGGYCCDTTHPYCTADGKCSSSSNDGSTGGSGGGGPSGGCKSGTFPCGADYCTPNGAECCESAGDPSVYCPADSVCLSGGRCAPAGAGGGMPAGPAPDCKADQMPVHDTCSNGDEVCGCADACEVGTDCTSGCCSSGFCAPQCVCSGDGTVKQHPTSCPGSASSNSSRDDGSGGFSGAGAGGTHAAGSSSSSGSSTSSGGCSMNHSSRQGARGGAWILLATSLLARRGTRRRVAAAFALMLAACAVLALSGCASGNDGASVGERSAPISRSSLASRERRVASPEPALPAPRIVPGVPAEGAARAPERRPGIATLVPVEPLFMAPTETLLSAPDETVEGFYLSGRSPGVGTIPGE
jgi:hypothetical protein